MQVVADAAVVGMRTGTAQYWFEYRKFPRAEADFARYEVDRNDCWTLTGYV